MRRLARWSLPAVLACLALAAAPAANAQEPTIVTDITFPEEGEPFGTFTASAPLCPSGTFVDEFVGGGGNFRGPVFYHAFTVRKHFTCANSSGTFTIVFHPQFTPATPPECGEAGPLPSSAEPVRSRGSAAPGTSASSRRETGSPRHSLGHSGSAEARPPIRGSIRVGCRDAGSRNPGDHVSKATNRLHKPHAIGHATVYAGVPKYTYHAPLDPECPAVQAFHASMVASEDARGCDPIEDFERRHRAECERCHVYGAVHMEVREA